MWGEGASKMCVCVCVCVYVCVCVCVCVRVCVWCVGVHVYNVCLRVCMCMSCVPQNTITHTLPFTFTIGFTKKKMPFGFLGQKKKSRVTFISVAVLYSFAKVYIYMSKYVFFSVSQSLS